MKRRKKNHDAQDLGDDAPSFMQPREDGGREWHCAGKLHRGGDLPAQETPYFSAWYRHGLMHRLNGPAYVAHDSAARMFFHLGKRHRADGEPAVYRPDGGLEWWENGERHRAAGPAIENPNGSREWWVKGKKKTFEEFLEYQTVLQKQMTVQKPLKLRKGLSPG
jgi:hypothetical protein